MALGTYNRTPANRTGGAMSYEAKYSMYEAMTASMQAGVRYFAVFQFSDGIDAKMALWWGYDQKYQMAASIQANAKMKLGIFPAYSFAANMAARANPLLEETYRMTAAMNASTALRIRITPIYNVMTASMNAYINSVQTQETIMTFGNLVIPPGSSLVVDSENYTITLDGENVIDQYGGDWIEFTRQLQGVDVTSGTSGDPQVSILYREKFL